MIPAKVFYEWDHQKHLTTFSLPDHSIIWMAGIYDQEYRFSVLTTAANESVKKIHDRMPLILAREDLRQWLFDFYAVRDLMGKKMGALQNAKTFCGAPSAYHAVFLLEKQSKKNLRTVKRK